MTDKPAVSAALPGEVEERDRRIAELERAIGEERAHSADLRATVQDLKFKLEILEKSYAKQLADARRGCESAEQALSQQHTRNAELDQAREDAIELLTDAKTEMDRLTEERDQLRRQLASRDGWAVDPDKGTDDDGGTINTLLDDASWLRKRMPSEDELARAKAEKAAAEAPPEEMISPDMFFAQGKGKE
jgi:chromosome segregation ATPase